ncbi:MAG: sulfotransferase [Kiritimatiellia bacterium]|jgi:hypothetical protein|nr:sulfotransferase [Kiritimatiellia bacterium]
MNPPIIIHIGLPKTATTTLQKHLFARHSEIDCIGQPTSIISEKNLHMLHVITRQDSLSFDDGFDRFLENTVNPILRACKRRATVLSEESFSTGASFPRSVPRREIASRLLRLFPEARILMVIRNQVDLLCSWYRQSLRHVDAPTQSLEEWFDSQWQEKLYGSVLPLLNYDLLRQLYEDTFGPDRVKIMLFESFTQHQEQFIDELSCFSRINAQESYTLLNRRTENVTVTEQEIALRRAAKHLPAHKLISRATPLWVKAALVRLAAHGRRVQPTLPTEWNARTADYYRESNRQLATSTNLPLAEHEYPL